MEVVSHTLPFGNFTAITLVKTIFFHPLHIHTRQTLGLRILYFNGIMDNGAFRHIICRFFQSSEESTAPSFRLPLWTRAFLTFLCLISASSRSPRHKNRVLQDLFIPGIPVPSGSALLRFFLRTPDNVFGLGVFLVPMPLYQSRQVVSISLASALNDERQSHLFRSKIRGLATKMIVVPHGDQLFQKLLLP